MDRDSADDSIRGALARNDPTAVELMWDRYARDLLAFLAARLRSQEDAEDVLQTVFIKMVRDRQRLAQARFLDAYVFRMAGNEAVTFLRRHRGRRKTESAWVAHGNTGAPDRDLSEQVQRALNKLPTPQLEVVVLKTYRDKTFEAIGHMLGISPNTAASRYRYGIEKLKILLKDEQP